MKLIFSYISLGLLASGGAWAEQPAYVTELEARQWLNKHVIAVNNDGRAIEPYDYCTGPTISLGIVHLHAGKSSTPLQISKASKDWLAALAKTGLECPMQLTDDSLLFRDVVVKQMLDAAARSERVVIFAHGGMNNRDEAIRRAWAIGHEMEKEGIYPIFVCWESSMGSSYGEHLFGIRNGVDLSRDNRAWVLFTAPIYFTTDIATSLVRLPRTTADLGRTLFRARYSSSFGTVQDADARYYALRVAAGGDLTELPGEAEEVREIDRAIAKGSRARPGPPVTIEQLADLHRKGWKRLRETHPDWSPLATSKGERSVSWGDELGRFVTYTAFIAPKLLVSGALAGMGADMWDVMSRRTQVMFHHEGAIRPAFGSKEFRPSKRHFSETDRDVAESQSTGIGAMSVFFRALCERQKSKEFPVPVTLVGHSMGAMVVNQALHEFPQVKCDEIVFMAAAVSIRDFATGTLPYLDMHLTDGNPPVLYNLTLHPRAEDRERSGGDKGLGLVASEMLPRGSLLVWIDEFLSHSQYFTDRTFGHFENAMLASRMFPPRLQKQIHVTALSVGPRGDRLQHHGDFSHYRFWDQNFYRAGGNELRDRFVLGSLKDIPIIPARGKTAKKSNRAATELTNRSRPRRGSDSTRLLAGTGVR